MNLLSILDPLPRLNPRRHIDGSRPDTGNRIGNVSGIETTGKNERSPEVRRNQRPVKNLAAATIPLDKGVKKNRLGRGKTTGVLYQISSGLDPRGLDVGPIELPAEGLVFVAVKLQEMNRHRR